VTRAQLRALGVTRGSCRWAMTRTWRLVLPSVICTEGARLTDCQRLVAALLHAGEGAAIGSMTAAAWHGITSAAGDPRVHVLAPDRAHPRSCGFVVVRRTSRPDLGSWSRGALVLCSRPRAVVDAARSAAPETARAIVTEAIERRLVRVQDLRHEVEAGARQGSAQVRRAVEDAEAGVWSVAEGDLARVLRRRRVLPPSWFNPSLVAPDGTRLPIPDAWFDDVGLVVQVHSRRWHAGALDWEATVMSDGVYAEYGIPVVAVTPASLREEPAAVLARIERAHQALVCRPRPLVRARNSTAEASRRP